MSDETWREKYRVAKLARCLECDETRASEMAGKMALDDIQFEQYVSHASQAVADLKARVGRTPTPAKEKPDREKVRASIADYLEDVFGLEDEGEGGQ